MSTNLTPPHTMTLAANVGAAPGENGLPSPNDASTSKPSSHAVLPMYASKACWLENGGAPLVGFKEEVGVVMQDIPDLGPAPCVSHKVSFLF